MRVVATAGHVDHGKSALVLALTGTDPDRFPEEKARGLTIDLGFAFTELPSGSVVGFVDVPGHVRFVKNMLAGVGAVDVALLVVAANEGWMPQTAEHVAILELLGVHDGMVALTKADLVDAQSVEIAQLELDEHLAGTALEHWPVVLVDSLTGQGLDEVRTTLDTVLHRAPAPRDDGRPRLWVDRVFSARGSGTIVTGTLVGGRLRLDEDVVVEPGARPARVRRIESHHAHRTEAEPGSRVALNLAGIEHHDVHRGDAVVRPEQWAAAATVDASVATLAGSTFPRHSTVHAYVGSGEYVARMRVLDPDGRFARITFDAALPLAPGDRLVLRSSGRQTTLGGAEVLDVAPTERTAAALARLSLPLGARVLDPTHWATRWATPADLVPLAGVADGAAFAAQLVADGIAARVGPWLVTPATLRAVRDQAIALVRAQVADAPGVDLASMASACGIDAARLRAALVDEPALLVARDLVRDAAGPALADTPAARALVDALARKPFDPPSAADVGASPALVRALVRDGTLVDLDGVVLTAAAFDTARRRVAAAVSEHGSITVSAARDLLGTSRKFVLPILNRLDAEGITRRHGDERVAGPRAAP